MNFIKKIAGDLLSLILGNNDENYEPTSKEYAFLAITIIMIMVLAIFLT